MGLGTWVEVAVAAGGPSTATTGHADQMVYDPTVDLALLYSAQDGTTWSWDGADWVDLANATDPPNLVASAVVYDGANSEIMMFGGYNGSTRDFTYTWSWGGNDWTLLSPAVKPSARQNCAIAYDEARGEVVLFGGFTTNSASSAVAETWVWNGTTWTQKSPGTSPSARGGMSMVYDRARANIVLYGGRNAASAVLDETWSWNGTTWTLETPTINPYEREEFGFCWDSSLGQALLYGGTVSSFVHGVYVSNETWAWTGSEWQDLTSVVNGAPAPTESNRPGMCYFETRREATVVTDTKAGGVVDGDTWVLPYTARAQLMRWH